jgi:NAD(P)-dependent dehydrogenase (short-subunit alcohol dehydrogenase family)
MARYEVSGRTVFITGAARGIGAESARRLHARGANVALVGLEPDRMEALAAELGDRAAVFVADTTDTGALERAVAGAVQRFGGVDVGIANAGIQMTGAVLSAPSAPSSARSRSTCSACGARTARCWARSPPGAATCSTSRRSRPPPTRR